MNKTRNTSALSILISVVIIIVSLFINGLGIYLTIRANIGASPWDVLNLGVSKALGIVYGNASVAIAFAILLIDVLMKEPIGLAMIIDAIVVGKSVDFFNWVNLVKTPQTIVGSIVMMIVGLFIIGYTQLSYMYAALGCGPRDTLLVGLKKHIKKIPIGVVSIILLSCATFVGFLLGGQVGIGTLICALCAGPIMQFAFDSVKFDAAGIKHQNIAESLKIIFKKQ